MMIRRTQEQIKADNAAFEAMAPEQKRMQIAKDVIAQLDAKRIVAKRGVWLSNIDTDGWSYELLGEADSGEDLKSTISNLETCKACAIGGLFMCAVERCGDDDAYYLDKAVNYNDHGEYLSGFFDIAQIGAIEAAFEQGGGAWDKEEYPEAAAFAPSIEDPDQRMRLIMQNIISNNGTFIP